MRNPTQMNRTPTLAEVIEAAIDAQLVELHTSMPGIVVAYDPDTQTADVQPALKRMYYDQASVQMPVLPGVPVVFPRGDNSHIHFPLAAGSPVQLVFSERSLEAWKTAGGIVDPDDPRKFSLSDAVCYPGGAAPPAAFEVDDPTAVEIRQGDSVLQLLPTGKFKLKNQQNELLDVLDQITGKVQELADTLGSDTVNTIFGPMPLNSFGNYLSLASDLSDLKAKLETLKG